MNGKRLIVLFLVLTFFCTACQKEQTGDLSLFFNFSVKGDKFIPNQRIYTNASGNQYEINDIMFFISNVCLHKSDGSIIKSDQIHYVDYSIFTSKAWGVQAFPVGDYDAVSFTFGIPDAQNTNYRFVNPPECDMYWPMVLGGGYHYMKINGKWKAADGEVKPFNMHSGRGQIYDEEGEITNFIDNSFVVTIPCHFTVSKSGTYLTLTMDLNQWFDGPSTFDLDYWGGSIMQNQAAQEVLKSNGPSVWTIQY